VSDKIIAISSDPYWLKAIDGATGGSAELLLYVGDYADYLAEYTLGKDAILLVDSTGQNNLAEAVRRLRKQGWNQIVVIAASSSWRDAYTFIHKSGAVDYWKKSYDTERIRRDVARFRTELTWQKEMIPTWTTR